ncbi:MAG: hypothetical protein ACTS4U_01180 [Candidatus Hodgkinia cicadicola]
MTCLNVWRKAINVQSFEKGRQGGEMIMLLANGSLTSGRGHGKRLANVRSTAEVSGFSDEACDLSLRGRRSLPPPLSGCSHSCLLSFLSSSFLF